MRRYKGDMPRIPRKVAIRARMHEGRGQAGHGRLVVLVTLAAASLVLFALQPDRSTAAVGPRGAAAAGARQARSATPTPATTHPDPGPTTTAATPSTVPTTTTVPSVVRTPATTLPPATPSPPPTPAPRGILPPANPSGDIAPSPNFLAVCASSGYDDSAPCVQSTLSAIDSARGTEGLPAMVLPGDWDALTPPEQLFVATNLERTARGLPPLRAMASALDATSQTAAADGDDPAPPASFPALEWGANWAGGLGNPLEAVYLWMYDDGYGSSNLDCRQPGASGCWGHRDNILMALSCHDCVMGTGFSPLGWQHQGAWAELLVDTEGDPALDYAGGT